MHDLRSSVVGDSLVVVVSSLVDETEGAGGAMEDAVAPDRINDVDEPLSPVYSEIARLKAVVQHARLHLE